MLQFGQVESVPEKDETLEALGYRFLDHHLHLISPEDYQKQLQGQRGFNRTFSTGKDIDSLVENLESNSTVVNSYILTEHEEELEDRLEEVLVEFKRSPEGNPPMSTIEEYHSLVKEGMQPSMQDEYPERLFIPHNSRTDFSNLRGYQKIVEEIRENGFTVEEVNLGLENPRGKNVQELEANLDYGVFGIKTSENEIQHYRMPEDVYWTVIPQNGEIEEILEQENMKVH